jgi:group I intron endonuclease
MKTGIIYKHENKINGKVYIGSTIQTTARRWRKSDKTYNSYKSCTVFYRALKKYSWNEFTTTVLEDNIPFDNIAAREEYYIKENNSIAPKGYNTVNIIDSRVVYTEETKLKISESRKEYYKNLKEPIIAYNRNHHIEVNDISCKKCTKCNLVFPLSGFNVYNKTWDKLMRICKSCQISQTRQYREKNPIKTLTKSEFKQSYRDRKTTARPFIGVNDNGDKLYFKSGVDASVGGFDKTGIRRSILNNKKYKGYSWCYADSISKIYARKCKVRKVGWSEHKSFLDKYHRQKSIPTTVCYGLYYEEELVCLMSFGVPRGRRVEFKWELYRLCYKGSIVVVGGASKLLKAFIKEYNPDSILSYAVSSYKNGGKVYLALGFSYIGETERSYHYIKDGVKYSRQKLMKHKLPGILGSDYDGSKSGPAMLKKNGFIKIMESTNNIYSLILT